MNSYERPHHQLERKRNIFFRIGLVISLMITFFAFEWKTATPPTIVEAYFDNYNAIEEIMVPVTFQRKEIQMPKEVSKNLALAPVIANPNLVLVPDNQPIDSTPFDSSLITDIIPITKTPEKDTVDEFISIPEIAPEFPGKEAGLYNFIKKNTKYPEMGVKEGINGTVYMNFVVDEFGKVTMIECVRSPHLMFTEEATRVLNKMPKWKPGMQGGKPVKVRMNIPITFKLL
jgi:periplasmic protein TonB